MSAYPLSFRSVVPTRMAGTCFLAFLVIASVSYGQSVRPDSSASTPADQNVVTLPPFSVSNAADNPYDAKDSISATRIAAKLIDTPQTVQVLTRGMLKDIGPTRIAEAMQYLPGVAEGSTPYFGDRTMLRGFSASSRVIDNFLYPAQMNQEPITVERIEVLAGPNAVLAPTGLPGGTINVVSKVPMFRAATTITGTVGAFEAQRLDYDSTGPIGGAGGKLAYRVMGTYQDTDGWIDRWTKKVQVISPALTWQPAPGTTLSVRYEYTDRKATIDPSVLIDPSGDSSGGGKLLTGLSRDIFFGDPSSLRTSRTELWNATLSQQLGEHIRMRLAGLYADYVEVADSPIGNGVNSLGGSINPRTGLWTPGVVYGPGPDFTPSAATPMDATNVTRNGSFNISDGSQLSFQNDFVAIYNLGPVSSQTVLGWAYNKTELYNFVQAESLPNFNPFAPVYGVKGTLGAVTRRTMTRGDTQHAYLVERVGLFSDRLFLSAGLTRYGAHSNTDGSRDLLNNAALVRSHVMNTTYMGGLVAKFRRNVSAYYGYSENASPVSSGILNSPILWQTGKQHEFGLKGDFLQDRFSTSLAYYEITIANFSIGNPARITDLTAPALLFVDEKATGVEWSFAGAITPNLSLLGGISKSKLRDPFGRRLRGVPDDTASIFASYRWRTGALKDFSLSLGVRYSGTRAGDLQTGFTALAVPIQPTFILPSYTLVNAGASYARGRYEARLYVDNLTNETYILATGSRTNVNMGPGLNTRLSVSVKF